MMIREICLRGFNVALSANIFHVIKRISKSDLLVLVQNSVWFIDVTDLDLV